MIFPPLTSAWDFQGKQVAQLRQVEDSEWQGCAQRVVKPWDDYQPGHFARYLWDFAASSVVFVRTISSESRGNQFPLVTTVGQTKVREPCSGSLIAGKCFVSDMRCQVSITKIRDRHLPGHVLPRRFPLVFPKSAVPYDSGSVTPFNEKASGGPILWRSGFCDHTR